MSGCAASQSRTGSQARPGTRSRTRPRSRSQDDCAVAPAPPPSPVVDPDHTRGRAPCALATADQPQDGVAADRHGKPSRQAGAGLAAERHADIGLRLGQAIAALCPRTGEAGNRLGEDPARTMAAAEAAHLHPPRHRAILPGQVLQGSPVRAMHPGRPSPTLREAARTAIFLAVIVSASASSPSSSTCTPSETEGNNGFEIRIALSLRHPRDQRFTRRSAPNLRKNQFAVSPDNAH